MMHIYVTIYDLYEKSLRSRHLLAGLIYEFFEHIAETRTWGRSPRTCKKDPCIFVLRPLHRIGSIDLRGDDCRGAKKFEADNARRVLESGRRECLLAY